SAGSGGAAGLAIGMERSAWSGGTTTENPPLRPVQTRGAFQRATANQLPDLVPDSGEISGQRGRRHAAGTFQRVEDTSGELHRFAVIAVLKFLPRVRERFGPFFLQPGGLLFWSRLIGRGILSRHVECHFPKREREN